MGYEANAKSGTIVPLRSTDSNATTSANGYFNTGTSANISTSGTINMSNLKEVTTSDYEIYITGIKVGQNYTYINIQRTNNSGNYYGSSSSGNSKNTARLYTSGNTNETNFLPEWSSEENNQFKLKANVSGNYKYFKYNTGSPRFAYYNSAGEKIVFYKKAHTLTYSATNGTIAGVDAGSNAVASGASVAENATVTLTATPSDGYEFSSWEVSGTGSTLSSTSTNPTTFTMGTADATVTANFTATGADNTITPIDDKEVGVLKSITLTPTSNNGTTPFSFSTTSDKISLSTTSGTSCEITGLSVTGETDAVVVIGQATGTHNATYYKAATPIYVNISVVDNRTTPDIIFSEDEIDLTAGDDQTITVTTDHTGTRSVTSSDDEIASVELSSGNVYVLAGDKGGTATITLSITENGDYKSTSKSFTVNVNDGKSDPTITVDKTEVGINTSDTYTLTSNSEGAITITMDAEYEEYAELKDNSDGTFNLSGLAEGTVTINVSQAENGSYRAYETTFNISVVDNRTTPTFSFSDASKIIEWADRNSYVKPTLTNTSDGTVTYTSSNTGVATVGSNGDITFVAGGETIITASVSGSANYKDAEASYTLTVNKPFEFAVGFPPALIP